MRSALGCLSLNSPAATAERTHPAVQPLTSNYNERVNSGVAGRTRSASTCVRGAGTWRALPRLTRRARSEPPDEPGGQPQFGGSRRTAPPVPRASLRTDTLPPGHRPARGAEGVEPSQVIAPSDPASPPPSAPTNVGPACRSRVTCAKPRSSGVGRGSQTLYGGPLKGWGDGQSRPPNLFLALRTRIPFPDQPRLRRSVGPGTVRSDYATSTPSGD